MIKTIIVDFGGVIARTEEPRPRHAWDERLGLPVGSVERAIHYSDLWVQAQLGRITPRAYWKGVAELLYMRGESIEELRQDYFSGDRLNYKLIELIRDMKARGCPVILLSNDSVELETRLRKYGIYDLFDHVLISAMTGVMKPDPTAFRVALQAVNAAPAEAVFIDDSLTNVRAAQAMGIRALLFRPDMDLRAELARITDEAKE